MSYKPCFDCCFEAPKSEDQKEDELRAYQHHMEEISNLPLEKGWRNLNLRLYQGFWFPEQVLPGVLNLRRHLCPAPTDIFLATYPKSGTTWLKALVFAICNRKSNQSSSSDGHLKLLSCHPQDCSPFLDYLFSSPVMPDLNALPSPRLLSTHIPYSVLPESVCDPDSHVRIIYMCREPKDTLVSTYHCVGGLKMDQKFTEFLPITKALEFFCKGVSMFGPIWGHQLEYWLESQRRPDKVLFLKYENLMAEPEASVRKIAEFMGMPFSREEENSGMVAEIIELCSFKKLSELDVNKVGLWVKDNELVVNNSSFFRKGKVGDWKEHISPKMAEEVDVVTRKKLHGTGLSHLLAPPDDCSNERDVILQIQP